jgi:hypothetical protein
MVLVSRARSPSCLTLMSYIVFCYRFPIESVTYAEGLGVHCSIELLRQKSKSARIDANRAHARIPQVRRSKLRKDVWFALRAVERMFLENADLLEDDIKNQH